MQLSSPVGVIRVVNEPQYSVGSVENARRYPLEMQLSGGLPPSSVHGVLLDGQPIAVIANGSGTSEVHKHSAVFKDGLLYLVVGDRVVCLSLEPAKMIWSAKVDIATCFGIYFDEVSCALISHGEMEIARLSADGGIVWRAAGADVFSERFALHSQFIEVIDFNGKTYRFRIEDGLPFPL